MICTIFFTLIDRSRQKKKNNNTGVGGNGSHSSGSGTGRDFPPVFSWDWDGKRFIFVGVGWERFENSLPCHPLKGTSSRHAHSLSYYRLAEIPAYGEEGALFVNKFVRIVFRCFTIHC